MVLAVAASIGLLMQPPPAPDATSDSLLSVAEASDYTATSTSAEVADLIERIRRRSSTMRVGELGKTVEGKSIPVVTVANPPVETAQQSARSGKPVAFIMANIHAGEVEGKEACLILLRELALNPEHPLLKKLIVVMAPNYNADGNDKFDAAEKNRPGQVGPVQCGVRANSNGLDLNRDYIKLEAPESRALVTFLTEWDPLITIDCHTTNGSHHRYVLTYEAPLNPSGHPAPMEFVRNQLLPAVTKRVKNRTEYDMWHYGNFNAEHTVWETYSAQPRFGGPYQGLRGQMSVLSEAYSYAAYKDRVIATTEFIREILQFTLEHSEQMMNIRALAQSETTEKGRNPRPDDVVGIRHRVAAFNDPVMVKGFEHASGGEGGAAADPHADLGPPKDHLCVHRGRFEPTLSVRRPYAYIIPSGLDSIVENLRRHGVHVEAFESQATVEVYTVKFLSRDSREFQGHQTVTLDVDARIDRKTYPPGSHLVRTSQPLGTLVVYLLEPESEDSLATWNFLDDHVSEGKDFPIVRVRSSEDLD